MNLAQLIRSRGTVLGVSVLLVALAQVQAEEKDPFGFKPSPLAKAPYTRINPLESIDFPKTMSTYSVHASPKVNWSNARHLTDANLMAVRSFNVSGDGGGLSVIRSKVVEINLSNTRITDAGLRNLIGEKKDPKNANYATWGIEERLTDLILVDTLVTDAGLRSLAPMKKLLFLDLGSPVVTPGGVAGTRVTKAGVEALQKALPRCRVRYEPREIKLTDAQTRTVTRWAERGMIGLTNVGDLRLIQLGPDAKMNSERFGELAGLPLELLEVREVTVDATAVKSIAGLDRLTSLALPQCNVTDKLADTLAPMAALELLDLANNPLTDKGLIALAKLPKLRELNVRGTKVTLAGMQQFHKLAPRVRLHAHVHLAAGLPDFAGDVIANDRYQIVGLKVYGRLKADLQQFPDLEQLIIYRCKLTKAQVTALGSLTKLRQLDMQDTNVKNQAMPQLAKLSELENLNAARIDLNDKGLSALKGHKNLRVVQLHSNSGITDASLEVFRSWSKLNWLDVSGSAITERGIARLRAALPNCKIIFDGDDDQ